ncbi:hypothetical protein EAI_08214, partial [Harpegnathos saltator]
VASEIEERRCDLIDRRRYLKDKVTTMERSIPALMTCNMWRMVNDCRRDAPYRIVRQIVDNLSPQPDPIDRLLAKLKSTVNELRLETAQLHDKIIGADVKLEETTMELESLELANKETEEKLVELRNQVQRYSTSSLHSIHSEDLICLKKIHQLAEEELDMKSCIKELEGKEAMYRRQMKQFLPCEKYQHDKEKKTCCSCPMSVTLDAYEQTPMKSFQTCRLLNLHENLGPSFSPYISLNSCAPCSATKYKTSNCRASSISKTETLRLGPGIDDGTSDEEFCECCSCDDGNEEST